MSFSRFQTSEINELKSQISDLQRLRDDAAISRETLRNKIQELEKERDKWKRLYDDLYPSFCLQEDKINDLKIEVQHWKSNHDNQVKLKSAIIDRLDCGDRARKVAALFNRVKELETAIENFEIKSSYDYHSKYYRVPEKDFLALIRVVNKK